MRQLIQEGPGEAEKGRDDRRFKILLPGWLGACPSRSGNLPTVFTGEGFTEESAESLTDLLPKKLKHCRINLNLNKIIGW